MRPEVGSDLAAERYEPRVVRGALPTLLTVEEVAAWLRTTPKGVYAMAERGQLPVTRVGARVLFDEADLLRWLSERRAKSPGGSGR
jgi:excisionase family DNA binding protein